MSARLPEYVEPLSLCDRGEQLQGFIPITGMARLADLLAAQQGEAEVELRFDKDLQGTRYLSGYIKSTLALRCQRCMEPVTTPIEVELSLGFVSSEAAGQQLPSAFEPFVMSEPTVTLRELVEDELILALPIVAMHPDEQCNAELNNAKAEEGNSPAEQKKENPFAVLAGLKKD